MGPRRILYFTAEGHYLFRSVRGALELDARFPADEAGAAEFREYLRSRRGGLFSVMVDLAGEDFHEEQIPYLRGSDREQVIQRRLAQRYRDTRLAAALSIGLVTAGERRNERLLLASFTNTQSLAPWLDALEEAGTKLAGVYSTPLFAPALAAKLGTRSGRAFVVTAHRAGLRQCYVEEGKLRFARLERAGEMVPQALAMFVRSETLRLAQYLTTLRVLPREGAPVQVIVVAPAGQRSVFEQVLVSEARLAFHTVDSAEAARAVGLRRTPEGAQSEALYLHLAARNPLRDQFASREERRHYRVWQLQRGIVAAGAAGFAACAIGAGVKWLDVSATRERALAQQQEARVAADQYERITAGFPVTQTSSENLKLTVVEFTRLAQASGTPEPALVHVSRALQEFPQIELEALGWSVGRPDAKPGAVTPGSSSQAGASGQQEGVLVEISGRVNATQRNDYRAITAQVQQFATALGGSSGYRVVRTQLPFDITSEGMLTGDIGSSTESGEAPRFTIVLARPKP